MTRRRDRYDDMAETAGKAGDLDAKQWPGLAIILRSLARDTIKKCDNAIVEAQLDDHSRRIARAAIAKVREREEA